MPWLKGCRGTRRSPPSPASRGRVWGFADGTGTLAPGAPADLVIWSGDPLELTTWAERVMIDGTWQDMRSRQTRLFERYRDLADPDFQYR